MFYLAKGTRSWPLTSHCDTLKGHDVLGLYSEQNMVSITWFGIAVCTELAREATWFNHLIHGSKLLIGLALQLVFLLPRSIREFSLLSPLGSLHNNVPLQKSAGV